MTYIVQSKAGCDLFGSLEYARQHAVLNAPATIWDRASLSEWSGTCVMHPIGTKPLEHVWGR